MCCLFFSASASRWWNQLWPLRAFSASARIFELAVFSPLPPLPLRSCRGLNCNHPSEESFFVFLFFSAPPRLGGGISFGLLRSSSASPRLRVQSTAASLMVALLQPQAVRHHRHVVFFSVASASSALLPGPQLQSPIRGSFLVLFVLLSASASRRWNQLWPSPRFLRSSAAPRPIHSRKFDCGFTSAAGCSTPPSRSIAPSPPTPASARADRARQSESPRCYTRTPRTGSGG